MDWSWLTDQPIIAELEKVVGWVAPVGLSLSVMVRPGDLGASRGRLVEGVVEGRHTASVGVDPLAKGAAVAGRRFCCCRCHRLRLPCCCKQCQRSQRRRLLLNVGHRAAGGGGGSAGCATIIGLFPGKTVEWLKKEAAREHRPPARVQARAHAVARTHLAACVRPRGPPSLLYKIRLYLCNLLSV